MILSKEMIHRIEKLRNDLSDEFIYENCDYCIVNDGTKKPCKDEDICQKYTGTNGNDSLINDLLETVNIYIQQRSKRGVMYSSTVAPFCPSCGSGEYLHNEDGNENNYCGQCGTRLDWDNMINEDDEE